MVWLKELFSLFGSQEVYFMGFIGDNIFGRS